MHPTNGRAMFVNNLPKVNALLLRELQNRCTLLIDAFGDGPYGPARGSDAYASGFFRLRKTLMYTPHHAVALCATQWYEVFKQNAHGSN